MLAPGSPVTSVDTRGLGEDEKIGLGGSGDGTKIARSREDLGLWDDE